MEASGQGRGESIFGLAKQLIGGFVGLARLEVAHARAEVGEMLATTRGGAIRIGIGLALLLLAVVAFVVFVILGLAALTPLPDWVIALIVFVVFGLLGGFFAFRGLKRIRVGPPEETIASVKEDIEWAKRLLRRG